MCYLPWFRANEGAYKTTAIYSTWWGKEKNIFLFLTNSAALKLTH